MCGRENAFFVLKRALQRNHILGHFSNAAQTELHTDASRYGIGAALMQQDPESKKEYVLAYASRTLSKPAQLNNNRQGVSCRCVVCKKIQTLSLWTSLRHSD